MTLLFRRTENLGFDFLYFGTVLVLGGAYTLWDRRYRRKWQQSRARTWRKVEGQFDEGEVLTMKKGRSGEVAGYEVWLGYQYNVQGEQGGLYTLPEMPSREEAEMLLQRLAHQKIPVRVAPGTPGKSRILDDDLDFLMRT